MNIAPSPVEQSRYYLFLANDLAYADTGRLMSSREEVSHMLTAYAAALLTPDF
jgi:hypothetical protein